MKQLTKKDLAQSMYASGRSVEEIAQTLKCSPSFVSNMVSVAEPNFAVSAIEQNRYARMFNGILRFKSVAAAQDSVNNLDALYEGFKEDGDLRGQHQAQLMALIGKNRAEGMGRLEIAQVFADWLIKAIQ